MRPQPAYLVTLLYRWSLPSPPIGWSVTALDDLYPHEGGGRRDHRWRLVVNVPEHELLD